MLAVERRPTPGTESAFAKAPAHLKSSQHLDRELRGSWIGTASVAQCMLLCSFGLATDVDFVIHPVFRDIAEVAFVCIRVVVSQTEATFRSH